MIFVSYSSVNHCLLVLGTTDCRNKNFKILCPSSISSSKGRDENMVNRMRGCGCDHSDNVWPRKRTAQRRSRILRVWVNLSTGAGRGWTYSLQTEALAGQQHQAHGSQVTLDAVTWERNRLLFQVYPFLGIFLTTYSGLCFVWLWPYYKWST